MYQQRMLSDKPPVEKFSFPGLMDTAKPKSAVVQPLREEEKPSKKLSLKKPKDV